MLYGKMIDGVIIYAPPEIYKGGELIRDMKPTLNSEGLYGLLDIVNNVFYASEVGSFTGPVPPSGRGSDANSNLVL